MKTFHLNEKDLIIGYHFEVSTIDKDDYRTADISFDARFNKFYIWFNGKLIHTCVGFKSVINRLNKLDQKFPLEDDCNFI